MADNLTLKVTLRGDGRHLSGTLRDASGEVREFGSTSDRSGRQSSAAFERTGRSVRGVNRDVADLNRVSDLARNSLLALGGAFSVREVINYSDAWTNTTNQIRTVSDSNERLIASQQRLMAIANDTRTSYESTANLYARLSRATTGLNLGYERTYRLVETINKSFAVSGATAEEASAAIVQLSQGLAAGALRGDEFNSVSEQAPAIMYAIADSLNMTLGELRAFASSGGITAEIVVNALEKAAAGIDKTFGGAIASFGQKMTVARNEMIEWVGTSQQVSDAVGLTGDAILGLTGHMDELVTIGAVLATVYGGRVAGALAASAAGYAARTVATIRDTQAQREAAAAEAGRQLALARTSAAEKTAEANNASLAARRALTARQDAANHAASLQQVGASLVAERELEAQRLKAQISATGRQQSVVRMAELRRSETTVTNQLAAANAKLAQAEAGVTSASRAATLASAEQAAATRAATTAQIAYTGAMRASTAAAGAMATAARGASAALALLGGPVGAALVAVGALYAFREELGLVSAKANATRNKVDELTGSLDGLTDAQIRNKRASLVRDLVEARIEAEKLEKQFSALEKQNRDQMVTNQGRPGSAWFQQQELSPKLEEAKAVAATLEKGLDTFDEKVDRLRQSATSGVKIFKTLDQWMFNTGDAADKAGKSLSKAAKAHENALRGLLDKLDPVAASQRDFLADQITLQTAWAGGKLTLDQYLTAVGQLPTLYQNAGDAAQVYELDGSKAAKTVSREMTATETIIKRSLERTDDAFVDFWENVISSSKNTFDAFKQVAISTLAEIIHAYTTRKITASLGLSLASTGSAAAGGTGAGGMGGFGGGGMDLTSLGKTIYQGITDGFGAINWTGAPTGATAYTSGFGSQVATGGGMFDGSLQNFSGFNGLASLGAGYVGSQLGTRVGSSLFGKQANSSWGATAGGAIGTYFGGPIGAFAGSTLGGMVDSLFGSGRKAKVKGWQGGLGSNGDNEYRDYHADTAFGTFTILDKVKTEPEDILNMLDAFEQIDGVLSDAMTKVQRKAVTDDFASGWKINESNVGEVFAKRYERLLRTLDGQASDGVEKALLERVPELTNDNTEEWSTALAGALQLNKLIDGLSGNVRAYASQVVEDTNLSIDDALSQITAGVSAHAAVSAIADELNLTFDKMGDQAVEASLDLAQLTGGLENLQSQAQTYYQNFFTDAERQQRTIEQLTPVLQTVGLSAASTREQFRDVVESLDLNTEAGRETYAELMSVAGAFAEISGPIQETTQSLEDLQAAAKSQVESAKDAVRQAYEAFASQAFDQQVTLLQLAGRDQEALNLQRQQELETIDESLRPIQERIWALQDEQSALQDARQASADYRSALEQASSQLDGTLGNISAWIDQQTATGGSPSVNLQEAQAQFARQLALAENGDRDALNSITQYADRYQQAGESYYGSGSGYQRIRDEVLDALGELPDQVSAEEYIADEIKQALIEQTDGITTKLADVLRGDNPASIGAELAGYFATLAGGIDGVLTRDQLKLVMNGKATDRQLDAMIRALDLNGDDIVSGLESVIVSGMPTDATLANVLGSQLRANGNKALTERQVRSALSPIATDAEIQALIRATDTNGDGLLDAQEVANARLGGLARGIGGALDPMFDKIDSSLDGLIDYGEFGKYFKGLASDSQLKQIFRQLDTDGDGQISALEAVKASTDKVGNNTGSIEERSLEQLERLNGLASEFTRTTDQFIGLNANMVSLRESINALGVAQEEAARIERERANALAREQEKVTVSRQISAVEASIDSYQSEADMRMGRRQFFIDATKDHASDVSGLIQQRVLDYIHTNTDANDMTSDQRDQMHAWMVREFGQGTDNYLYALSRMGAFRNEALAREAQRAAAAASETLADLQAELDRLDGSHANGLSYVPWDGYRAELHQGEHVSTAKEAPAVRAFLSGRLSPPPMAPAIDNRRMERLLDRLAQLTQENTELLRRIEAHEGAGVRVAQAGHQRSIDQLTRIAESNQALDDRARLEALA
ncbi:tape measure protein [Salinicola sp. RZ23]|uniref:tape measure protein n=1 Tax=Salinicola sp. RZ23 TaxID=1949087 RepID=UPI000DA1AC0A|nr:tape measure protein [Salinicola sp. RZ23]